MRFLDELEKVLKADERFIGEDNQVIKTKVSDAARGAGGMFIQSAKFVENHQGRVNELSIFGQESNANTWKLAQMNLAIHGLEGDLGQRPADTFFPTNTRR